MERLVTTVEQLARSVEDLIAEGRKTNESVNELMTSMALTQQTVDTHGKEIYAGDNSSRIRTLELHVKGLYAMVGFVVVTIGGQVLALLSHWHAVLSK